MSAAAVPPHPRVPVWLRPLTRRRGEVQFGVLPGGPVVTGVSDTEAEPARPPRRRPAPRVDRPGGGRGGHRARTVARAARASSPSLGVLTDRQPPATSPGCPSGPSPDPAPTRVVVDGCGAVATDIAEALTQAGTTVVHGRAAVDRAVAAPLHPRPDLVVLVGSPVVDPRRGDLWLRHGVPHLPVAPAGPRTVVGPLVDGSPGGPASGVSTVTAPTATPHGPR